MQLTGQVALVTAAGHKGIGRAIAKTFAREGARVAVTGRNKELQEQVAADIVADGGEALPFVLDVSKEDQVEDVINGMLSTWGRIDILVNNAARIHWGVEVWETTIEQFDDVMNANLKGPFLTCRAVIPHMMSRGSGVIVNIGTLAARMLTTKYGPGTYGASKFGLIGYTTSLARSLRPYGIQVNGINPGGVDTEQNRQDMLEGHPDWSTPEEIANAVLFLATRAPKDMTGQFIDLFGS
jgi:3-oxoacyl-[acyl-carrier protein] reductase